MDNVKNSHIENKEKVYNINMRMCMKLEFFLLKSEIGSFNANLKENTHM